MCQREIRLHSCNNSVLLALSWRVLDVILHGWSCCNHPPALSAFLKRQIFTWSCSTLISRTQSLLLEGEFLFSQIGWLSQTLFSTQRNYSQKNHQIQSRDMDSESLALQMHWLVMPQSYDTMKIKIKSTDGCFLYSLSCLSGLWAAGHITTPTFTGGKKNGANPLILFKFSEIALNEMLLSTQHI